MVIGLEKRNEVDGVKMISQNEIIEKERRKGVSYSFRRIQLVSNLEMRGIEKRKKEEKKRDEEGQKG